jgi:hypothetical protein
VVALARADVEARGAQHAQRAAQQQLAAARAALTRAVAELDAERGPRPTQAAAQDAATCAQQAGAPPTPSGTPSSGVSGGAEQGEDGGGIPLAGCGPAAAPAAAAVVRLEEGVVAADEAVRAAKAAHKAAAQAADGAERAQRAALARLQLCSAEPREGQGASLLPGLAGEVGAALQLAYAKLWRRQLREGAADMRRAARLCASALRRLAQRSGGGVADLSGLQRLAAAAADPLLAVGRVAGRLAAGSLGSTTAAALMGGLGVLRLGMGVAKAGAQLTLFLAMLYYLLAAQADPLLAAARVLPLGDAGRQRTAVALNRALAGGPRPGGVGVLAVYAGPELPGCWRVLLNADWHGTSWRNVALTRVPSLLHAAPTPPPTPPQACWSPR